MLQTTSYNFTGTATTSEICAGIVKVAKVFPKNPAQHFADLEMLSGQPEFHSVFRNSLGCIRVDGATDKGPSHDVWWTVRHLKHKKLVSSHSSGFSYLNRVELQNGCLSPGHTNLFIPSTLCCSTYSPETGPLDAEVRKNLEAAMDVYIDHVNQCPCGETVIHLFRGDDSSSFQEPRENLLKGNKS